jgi:hypothetical protein
MFLHTTHDSPASKFVDVTQAHNNVRTDHVDELNQVNILMII